MAHPAKRRRLESLPQFSGDDDDDDETPLFEDDSEQLHPEVRDRIASRNRFKSALEDIFDKYGQDFTGIGDEIDLRSGRVIVDNGHLMRMEDEGDTGEQLEAEEEEESDESDASLSDDTRHAPRNKSRDSAIGTEERWDDDEQPLASLHLDFTINKQSAIFDNHRTQLKSQAKDPKWQIPDLPIWHSESKYDYEDEMQATVRGFGPPGPKKLKSPGKSLWKHARYSKNHQNTSPWPSRTQNIWHESSNAQDINAYSPPKIGRGRNTHNDESLYGPGQGSDQIRQTSSMLAEERAIKREAAGLLARTGEWTVLEDQELIKHRLDAPRSFAALALEFPGRTSKMVKHRWRYLKKKMIELPATTAIRTAAASREIGTYEQHGRQNPLRLPNTGHGLGKSRGKLLRGSSHKHDETVQPPRITIGKSLISQDKPRVYQEALYHAKDHKDDSVLPPRNSVIVDLAEHSRQPLNEDSDSRMPTLVARQEEGLHHALQASDCQDNIADNLFPPYKDQRTSGDMWNTFLPFEQLQNVGDEHAAMVDNSENGLDMDCYTNWQDPTIEAPVDSFWIPYGPVSNFDSVLPNITKQSELQEIPTARAQDAVDNQSGIQGVRNNTSPEAGLLCIDSQMVSSTVDPGTLDSQTGIQPNHIPVHQANLHAHLKHADHVQPHSTDQAGQSNKDAGVRILSQLTTIPDTQDPNSSTVMVSSGCLGEHVYHASQSALPNIQISTKLPLNEVVPSLQKHGNDPTRLMPSSSRQSSPLSSLSSSDPRIARSSDMSSSVSVKETEIGRLCDTSMESSEPTIKVQAPVASMEVIEQIGPQSPASSTNVDQVIPQHQNALQQDDPPAQLSKTIVLADKSVNVDVELSNSSPRSNSHKQKTRDKENTILLQIMEADDDFQSVYDSWKEHNILMEPLVKQKQVSKNTAMKGSKASHSMVTIRQHRDSVTHPGKVFKFRPQIFQKTHKVSKSAARQIQENTKSLSRANSQFTESSARKVDEFDFSRQRITAVPKRKVAFNYMAFKDSDATSLEGNHLPRREREMTPIDTYDYILADPWPVDPLPADRIPGIWRPPQVKNEILDKSRTEETALQHPHQDVCPSSLSASSEPKAIDSRADEKLQDQTKTKASNSEVPERRSKQTLPLQSHSTQKPEYLSIIDKVQMIDQRTHTVGAVESKKSNSTSVFPIRNDTQLPLPRSPGGLALDRIKDTPRTPSPIRKAEDIVLEFGKGRPLTKANLLSQDEIPSTSQETVLSFLNSQATQPSKPTATPRSSLLAHRSRARSVSSANVCGVNGFRCDKRVCSRCNPRIVSQEEVDF